MEVWGPRKDHELFSVFSYKVQKEIGTEYIKSYDLQNSEFLELTFMLLLKEHKTYLTKDKCIEYQRILHFISMGKVIAFQVQYTPTMEVENEQDSDLIHSLEIGSKITIRL